MQNSTQFLAELFTEFHDKFDTAELLFNGDGVTLSLFKNGYGRIVAWGSHVPNEYHIGLDLRCNDYMWKQTDGCSRFGVHSVINAIALHCAQA